MRTLFIPLARLLGIYEIIRGGSVFLSTIYGVIFVGGHIHGRLTLCIFSAPSIVLGIVLLWKAEAIADLLKMDREETSSLVFDFDSVLRAGLLLIGVALLMTAIPTLLLWLIFCLTMAPAAQLETSGVWMTRLYGSIIRTVFGCCIILLSNRLTQLLSRQNRQTSQIEPDDH